MRRIVLDTVRKDRNQSEWRMVNRASCDGLEELGDHEIIGALCRKMIAEGASGEVEVWRNGRRIFAPYDINKWASGLPFLGKQPEHLRK